MKKNYLVIYSLLFLICLPVFNLSASALSAERNIEQIIKEKKLSINIKDAHLEDILKKINEITGIEYAYQAGNNINSKASYSLNVKEKSIDESLDILFAKGDYGYKVYDDKILIVKKEESSAVSVAQQKTIDVKGIIVDEENNPISGATVIVAGTADGCITDAKGAFFVRAKVGDIIEISFIGYTEQKFTVTDSNMDNVTIKLEVSHIKVDDVVVTGYQKVSSRELASAITTVKQSDINIVSSSSIDQMLQGQVAGLMVMNTSGEPSATPTIRIRGNSTINGNKSPLWVLDGVILEELVDFDASDINSPDASYLIGNAISGINPNDIETITVLKDASATAIYGVSAANGVIVVTTKDGAEGKARISYNGGITINRSPSYSDYNLMSASERILLSKEIVDANLAYSSTPSSGDSYEGILEQLYQKEITQSEFAQMIQNLANVNTDWYDILFNTSVSHTHQVNVSGGTETMKYYASAGYSDQLGGAIGSGSEKFTSLAKISLQVNKDIDFNLKLSYNTTNNLGYNGVNVSSYAYNTSRTLKAYNDDGSYYFYPVGSTNSTSQKYYNILNELETTGMTSKMDDFDALLGLNANIIKGLKYSGTFSYSVANTSTRTYATDESYNVASIRGYAYDAYSYSDNMYQISTLPYGGTMSLSSIRNETYTIRNVLDYNLEVGDGRINLMGGTEIYSLKRTGVSVTGYGWLPEFGDSFSPVYTDNYITTVVENGLHLPTNTNSLSQTASLFAVASYSHKGKYILNGNIRSDGSNKFGSNPEYRWQPTWSIAGRWNVTGEEFMYDCDWVDMLSVRASYGVQGNINDYATPELIVSYDEMDSMSGQVAYSLYRLPNPDLHWEKSKMWNLATDFSMFKNRLNGTIEVYGGETTDLLMDKNVASSYGQSSLYINSGEMIDFGVEANFNVEVIRSKTFDWRLGLTVGRHVSTITSANGGVYENVDDVEDLLAGNVAVEGEAFGSMYAYKFVGLNPENGYPLFQALDGSLVHEGTSYLMELVNVGSIFPIISGGFSTSFTFKKALTLSAHFTYNLGGVSRLPEIYEDSYGVFDPLQNLTTTISDRWKEPGDEAYTTIPALIDSYIEIADEYRATEVGADYEYFTTLYNYSDERVASSSYLRLSTVTLRYAVPEKLTSKYNLSSVNLALQATNLALWAAKEWEGLDPETADASIPLLPTYSLSVQITF